MFWSLLVILVEFLVHLEGLFIRVVGLCVGACEAFLQQLTVRTLTLHADKIHAFLDLFFLHGQDGLHEVKSVGVIEYRDLSPLLLEIGFDHVIQHFGDLFSDEGDRPLEYIEEVGQEVGMDLIVELLNIKLVVLILMTSYFEFDNCPAIFVDVAVVGSREDCNDYGEVRCTVPFVHLKSLGLCFVGSDDTQTLGLLKEGFDGIVTEEVGTAPDVIEFEWAVAMPIGIIHWIGPHHVAEHALLWNFSEAIEFCHFLERNYVG